MAAPLIPTSTGHFDVVHQVLEPVQVQSNRGHASHSPLPFLKKCILLPSKNSAEDHGISTWSLPFIPAHRIRFKLFLILAALLGLFCWWTGGTAQSFQDLKQGANSLLLPPALDGFHFIPASNQHIHYVGRWTYTPNRLRRDSNFPGAYLEFVVRNCSSIYLSLQNSDLPDARPDKFLDPKGTSKNTHLNFHHLAKDRTSAGPVSLVTRIDLIEHRYFYHCGRGLVAINTADLKPSEDHIIRVGTLSIDGEAHSGMEFEGIWLSTGAWLVPSQKRKGSSRRQTSGDVLSVLPDESTQYSNQSSKKIRVQKPSRSNVGDDGSPASAIFPGKTLEIVTDIRRPLKAQNDSESLAALMGWDDLMGDMFGVNHISIAVDGLCLSSPCIGGGTQHATIKDTFFRSGPPGSASFTRSWNFRSYIPDAMVLVLGSSDEASFQKHDSEYEETIHDLQRKFEDAYVKFVQTIRRAAYPLHPAALHEYSSNADGFVYNSAPATIPIFVVTPFHGEISHSTQKVVERLQSEGDNAVFWVDTSGWFSSADFDTDVDDPMSDRRGLRLNAQGNRKAAVYLHGHLCHYVAEDQSQCPFLRHEAYTGKVYVPRDAELDKLIEESKIKKLKALFWTEDGDLIMRSN